MTRKVTPTAATRIVAIEIVRRARRPRTRSRLATVAEPVTDRPERLDRRRVVLAGELAPQVADVHLHHVGAGVEVIAPDRAQDLLAREHLVLAAHEVDE